MGLTPNEILNKEFDTKFRGYDTDQVNDYLDLIVVEFERLITENNELKSNIQDLEERNNYFAQLQDSLNSSIVVAQEAAERLKENARKEAELILYEAERQKEDIINGASDMAQSIVTETEALRRSSSDFRDHLEERLSSQLDVVRSSEYKKLFEGADLESQFNPQDFQRATESATDRMNRLEEENNREFQTPTLPEQPESVQKELAKKDISESNVDATTFEDPQETMQNESTDILYEETATEKNASDDTTTDFTNESESTGQIDLPDLSFDNHDENDEGDKSGESSLLGQTIRIDLPED